MALAKESLAAWGFLSDMRTRDMLLVGYSSGAIFSTALLAAVAGEFLGAILIRPEHFALELELTVLDEKPVLVISGERDQRRHPRDGFLVAEQLSKAGARVTHHHLDTGHGWASDDQDLILSKAWMDQTFKVTRE